MLKAIKNRERRKKIVKFALAIMLSFALTGCIGGSSSTKEQEKIVTQYFDYIKEAKVEKAIELELANCRKSISKLSEIYKVFLDEKLYGEEFVNEGQKFIDSVLGNYIKEYKIKDAKIEDDETIVTITGKKLNIDILEDTFSMEEVMEIAKVYQKEHADELEKIYIQKGQTAVMKKIYGDIAKEIFALFIEDVESSETVDFVSSIKLVKENNKWVI